jgi:hypothetical protein
MVFALSLETKPTFMKGILIDAVNQEIKEVTFSTPDEMRNLIGCELFEVITYKNMGVHIFVDEEGMLKINKDSGAFMVSGWHHLIVGNGLCVGLNEETGQTIDCPVGVEEIENLVEFYDVTERMV